MNNKFKKIVPLHVHSCYSLLDAIPTPKDWILYCSKNEIPAIAITDHGMLISLYDILNSKSIIKKHNQSKNENLQEVIGIPACEFYVFFEDTESDKKYYHINVYAISKTGLKNLVKLGSEAWKNQISIFGNVKPRVKWEDLIKHKEGLVFSSACLAGYIGLEWLKSPEKGEEAFKTFIESFGKNSFIEFIATDIDHEWDYTKREYKPIKPTPNYPNGNKQEGYNKFLYKMVKKYGGIPIPTTDAHFIKKEDKVLQDILLKNGLDNGWYFYESCHQKEAEECFEVLSRHIPELTEEEFSSWIDNTYLLIEGAKTIKFESRYRLPKPDFPEYIEKSNKTYDEKLLMLLSEKIKQHKRWINDPVYIERFKQEIDVITNSVGPDGEKINFLPYFFLYEKISFIAKEKGTLQNLGRGSAAGCLLSYYLGITHIDPIKTNLPFERFLSKSRIKTGSFPDIDVDFGNRDVIVEELKNVYGSKLSQISTYQTFKASSAIKGVMHAVYSKKQNDVDLNIITKGLKAPSGVSDYDYIYGFTDKEGEYHKGQLEENEALKKYFESYNELETLVPKLLGIPKALGRHASAFIISDEDLEEACVPLAYVKTAEGELVKITQWDAPKMEAAGFIKADILGLTTILVLDECIRKIKERIGKDYLEEDENGVALVYRLEEYPEVFKDISAADTITCFQTCTPTAKNYITKFAPASKEMLADFTSLVRPGSLDAIITNSEVKKEENLSATQYYIDVRNNNRKLAYIHPDLAPYQTNGVFIYQEQIMALFVGLAGYTMEEADTIRTAIAKKKKEKMDQALETLKIKLKERDWTKEQIEALIDQVKSFASYSFNRSHARCYGEMSYITSYMKHFYPLEWFSSCLNFENDPDKIQELVKYLQQRNMFGQVDLYNSTNEYSIVNDKIIPPYHYIHLIGRSVSATITKCKPFSSLEELYNKAKELKLPLNIGHFVSLAFAGVCNINDVLTLFKNDNKSKALKKLKNISNSYIKRYLCKKIYNKSFKYPIANSYVLKELVENNYLKYINNKEGNIFYRTESFMNYIKDYTVVPLSRLENIEEEMNCCVVGVVSEVFKSYQGTSKNGKKWTRLQFVLDGGDDEKIITYWDPDITVNKNSIVLVLGRIKTLSNYKNGEKILKKSISVDNIIEVKKELTDVDFNEES